MNELEKTENLALKREVARLNKVIEIMTGQLIESYHAQSAILCDKKNSTKNSHQNGNL